MRTSLGLGLALVAALFFAGNATAYTLGNDVTDADLQEPSTNFGASPDLNRTFNEDNETEIRDSDNVATIANDLWDLEGFYLKDEVLLQMVGTFDFAHGQDDFESGDIFIDTDGIVSYGGGSPNPNFGLPNGSYGYEYALHFDWDSLATGNVPSVNYELIKLTGVGEPPAVVLSSTTLLPESSPWRYVSGGDVITTGSADLLWAQSLDNNPLQVAGNSGAGVYGGLHNVVEMDWDSLAAWMNLGQGSQALLHFTMECGNDVLVGNFAQPRTPDPVPEPASMALLGMGILCVAMRKRFTA